MTVNTQELRELAEKATPGPWFHGAKNGEHKYCVYDKVCWTDDDGRHGETPNMVVHVSPDDGKYHDAAYIAAAHPATVSALLDEIGALRAALHTLICEVVGLAEESEGVYGLHLNGDPSPWEELLPGGRFERLTSLHDAEALIAPPQGDGA